MNVNLKKYLRDMGYNIGLNNDKFEAGTWEWYDKDSGEYRGGFMTISEAYTSLSAYVLETTGNQMVLLDDDDEPMSEFDSLVERAVMRFHDEADKRAISTAKEADDLASEIIGAHNLDETSDEFEGLSALLYFEAGQRFASPQST